MSCLLYGYVHTLQTNEENFKQHGEQLGTVVSDNIKKKLSLELQNLTVRIFSSYLPTLGSLLGEQSNSSFL